MAILVNRIATPAESWRWVIPSYTVATLPSSSTLPTPIVGELAFATNGRVNGQTAGNGTGGIVVWNGTSWIVMDTGIAVAS